MHAVSSHTLSFATLNLLQDNTVELIVDQDVEINIHMVREWMGFIRSRGCVPARIMVNKLHPCSYTFDALMQIAEIDFVKAIAFVNYSVTSKRVCHSIMQLLEDPKWQLSTFDDRELALRWLSGNGMGCRTPSAW